MGLRLRPDAAKDSVSLREFDWREKNTENLAALGRTQTTTWGWCWSVRDWLLGP
jgi:hypothetical protein